MALRRRAPILPPRGTAILLSALALAAPARGVAQDTLAASGPTAVVRDLGPGVVGRLLRDVLAAPHRLVVGPDTGLVLGRGVDVPGALVALHGPLRLEGRVHGDVVVLGDLVLRPGAVIDGRAIAIGGVVAPSALAIVRGARLQFPDETFAISPIGATRYVLDYRALARERVVRVVSLPGVFGLGIPSYDRVDGLSASFGPEIALDSGDVRLDPTITYRSQLGVLDPGARLTIEHGRRTRVSLDARRATFTNDAWIYGDLVNSALAFGAGIDMRNYYRADRAELRIERDVETTTGIVTPFVGAAVERAWSVARAADAPSVPYSMLGRQDTVQGMRRPNPAVTGGRISSALGGAAFDVLRGDFTANGGLRVEVAPNVTRGGRFAQTTLDATVSVPTFGSQRFVALAHAVATTGDSVPAQRYAYLGGGSTIPTLDPLVLGGDRLVWLDSRYVFPLPLRLPLGNAPSLALRYVVGSAGVGRLPAVTQNVGVRVMLGFLRFDFVVDPTDTHRHATSFGFGLR